MELGELSECAFFLKERNICSNNAIINDLKDLVVAIKQRKGEAGGSDMVNLTPETVIGELKKETGCNTESCVLKSKLVASKVDPKKLEENARRFKPDGPYNSTKWLSNINIDEVLDQVAIKHKDFIHVPFQMIDFAEAGGSDSLSNVNLVEKIKQGMKSFGVVINTDSSRGSGKHWFALYGDFSKEVYTLEYFNSSGHYPATQVSRWLEDTRNKLEQDTGKKVKVVLHTVPLQNDDHSCGPYSLYYIMSRVSGVPWEQFKKKRISDRQMVLFRKHLFVNS